MLCHHTHLHTYLRTHLPACSDNADLEAVLKETERQRREFAARYAFMTLDTDGDGYVSVEQVSGVVG